MARRILLISLSLPGFLLYAIASVLSAPLAYLQQNATRPAILFLGVVITAVAGLVAWLTILIRRPLRLSRAGNFIFFLLQLVVIGTVRGIAFFGFADLLGLEQPATLTFRILNSIIITVVWLWLSCAVISGRREYMRTYRTLVNQAVFSAAQGEPAMNTSTSVFSANQLDDFENIVALKADLHAIQNTLDKSGVSHDSLKGAADSVREVIETTLRPMSHRMWFNATDGTPQLRARGLIQDALISLRYSIPRVLLICSVPMFVGGLAFLPLMVNLVTIVISSVVLAALLGLHRTLTRSLFKFRIVSNTLFLFITGILTYALTYFMMQVVLPDATTTFSKMAWVTPLAIWVIVWADSALQLISQDRQTITSALRERVNTHPSPNEERLASYLHNSLQSELTGLAYQLEKSAMTLDSQESRRSLEQLGSLISRSISEDFVNFTETPLTRITRVMEAWSGIARVQVLLEPTINEDDPRLVLAVQVAEEGITNAVRHGQATAVDVTISRSDYNLVIELTSNQQPSANEQKGTGIGYAWLNRYSIERHSVIYTNGVRVLRVEL